VADRVLLYISAASDLTPEREVLGQAVTEIPTSLGWRITQTPVGDEPLDLQAAAQADLHLLILGGDIRAPVGAEWLAAQRAGHMPTLFLKQSTPHTPAALFFIRDLERYATWLPFDDAANLRRQVLTLLVEHILNHAIHYQISPDEFEKLRAWRKQLETPDKKPVDKTRGGAGASSVILSPERFIPSEGKLIGQAEPKRTVDPGRKRRA
jgi:hypothetical protein